MAVGRAQWHSETGLTSVPLDSWWVSFPGVMFTLPELTHTIVQFCDADSRIALFQAGIKAAIGRIKDKPNLSTTNVTHWTSCVDIGIPGTVRHYVIVRGPPRAIMLINMSREYQLLDNGAFTEAGWCLVWGC